MFYGKDVLITVITTVNDFMDKKIILILKITKTSHVN